MTEMLEEAALLKSHIYHLSMFIANRKIESKENAGF